MRKPLRVGVIARVLFSFDHCGHCQVFLNAAGVGQQVHREDFRAFPQEVREDHDRLVTLVEALSVRFGGRVRFKILDPQTLEGVWTSLRYWVRQYPTFLVEGEKVVGWDEDRLVRRIEAHLGGSSCGAARAGRPAPPAGRATDGGPMRRGIRERRI